MADRTRLRGVAGGWIEEPARPPSVRAVFVAAVRQLVSRRRSRHAR